MKGVTTMKYLKIDKSKGYYLDKNENYKEIDQINGEDIFYILDSIITKEDFEMDEYDEEKPQNQVHRIIYKELYDKFLSFKDQKEEIKNEIDNLYIEAKNKYVQK
jgi:hypothetical protein